MADTKKRHGPVFARNAAVFAVLLCGCLSVRSDAPVPVRTARLADVAIYPQRSAPATVKSLNEAAVSAQIAARVTELPARVGEVVDPGAVLAVLECTDFELRLAQRQAELKALEARIRLAERRVRRTKQLLTTQSAAEDLLDEREADLAVLEAERRGALAAHSIARTEQARCTVESPYRAVVLKRLAAVGDYARAGTPLVRILDVDTIEVAAQVAIGDVQSLTAVRALYFEHAGEHYPVTIQRVVPAVNTESRNREVRLDFAGVRALPGSAGQLIWKDVRPHIPGELLVQRDGRFGVFVESSGLARFVAVPAAQPGRASPADIPDNTRLIVEGYFGLRDTDQISVVN